MTNEKGEKKAMLQSDQVLVQLKTTYGHARDNVFKRKQSMIESTSNPTFHLSPRLSLSSSPNLMSDAMMH